MSQIKIVNVEDYAPGREATSAFLRLAGFDVFEAANGKDAMTLVVEVRPQLILLDVKLPDMSGHEVCQRLKASEPTIPILEVSASLASGRDRVLGLESGADACLPKPVEPEELLDTIKALLRMSNAKTARCESEKRYELLFEKERKAREEAETANSQKDEFLATVSHELRAPLNAMLGWAQILRSTKVDSATLAHAIEIIERSARTQSRLIEDLLDTARIASGKLRLDIQPVDLTSLIENAVEVQRPASEAKRIEIELELNAGREVITGDPDRLQQVVWNVLSNAIKFTPKGGGVVVRLERADPHVRITVTDTGPGISPEYLPFIFDRFHQADSSSTRRSTGLGLGLSLVRHLVELHGGTVTAENLGEGQGARFTINLPLRAVLPQTSEGEPPVFGGLGALESMSLEGVWVLVVDDEADARDLVATLLEQCGAKVTPVGSALEALAVISSDDHGRRPDVVVSDVSMPEVDGYELMRRVRDLAPEFGGLIPAVALTAYGRSIDRIRALSAGFQMHMPKPVEPAELATVVATLTGLARKGRGA
jgi:signal transduction histidine kinase